MYIGRGVHGIVNVQTVTLESAFVPRIDYRLGQNQPPTL